jgi:hypothetical protein
MLQILDCVRPGAVVHHLEIRGERLHVGGVEALKAFSMSIVDLAE